ncbi:MAG: DNA polymerase III subunit delta [Candidatus Brocadiae bacterium]|nr:DNA polymerase III subunit delta [Candidatus Brocadiia bacterium]
MKYTQFEKSIQKSPLKPVYIILGTEKFLKTQAMDLLKKKVGEGCFYKEYASDENFSSQNLFADLYSESLFDERNFIVLKDAGKIFSKLGDPLMKYLQSPCSFSTLVLELDKIDQRTKLGKFLKEYDSIIECEPLKENVPWSRENELVKWICQYMERYQKRIKYEAAEMLSEYVGNNLSDLALQIEKLAVYVKEKKEIVPDDIKAIVQATRKVNVFDFQDAISSKDLKKAVKLCDLIFKRYVSTQDGTTLSDHTGIALYLIKMIHKRMKDIWKISISQDTKNIHSFVVSKLQDHCKNFTADSLREIWRKILEAQMDVKISRTDPALSIEKLVFFICAAKTQERR